MQRLARENGLFFAPDPGAAEQSQIGGNVATNAGGPHALKYGVTGAWVAGLEVVLAPGELVQRRRLGGKDVAGYDLKSLLIGSEGTLGVITAVRLRLLPAPEAAIAAGGVPAPRAPRAARRSCAVLAAGLRPSVLDFLDGETLRRSLAGAYPGARAGRECPRTRGFALIVELDGSARGGAGPARRAARAARRAARWRCTSRPTRGALWRWRDGVNGASRACAARR